MTRYEVRQRRLGLALVASAAICWSSSALFIRYISADLPTMVFWRGIFSGAAVMVFFFILERHRGISMITSMRWPSLIVMLACSMSMICGTAAIRFSTAADALTIYATVPFVTAAVAWAAIGERPAMRTLIAASIAIIGVIVMLGGAAWDGSLFGKILAFGPAIGMAIMTTTIRRHSDIAMMPALGLSCWVTSLAVLPFAAPLAISNADLLLCAAFGIFQNATGLALYAVGSRRVPAAEATLLAALEVPLSPFWVWLVLNETPAIATLVGGAIVLTAMFGHILLELRGAPSKSAASVA